MKRLLTFQYLQGTINPGDEIASLPCEKKKFSASTTWFLFEAICFDLIGISSFEANVWN